MGEPRLIESAPLRYLLSVPTGPETAGPRPVLVFLHGYDEGAPMDIHRALTLHGPLRPGNPAVARQRFVIVAPQLPARGDLWLRSADAVLEIVRQVQWQRRIARHADERGIPIWSSEAGAHERAALFCNPMRSGPYHRSRIEMLKVSSQLDRPNDPDYLPQPVLAVNGEVIPNSRVNYTVRSKFYAELRDPESASLLTTYTLNELANHFQRLSISLNSPFKDLHLTANFLFDDEEDLGIEFEISYCLYIQEWTGPWSMVDYEHAIADAFEAHPQSGLQLGRGGEFPEENMWKFQCVIDDVNLTAESVINRWLPTTETIIRNARVALRSDIIRDTLVTLFDFPRHVSTACEQYLLYFVQFLRDLGIEATASIKHEAHQILFSVTPKDGADALERIRAALDVYLQLPGSPEFAALAPRYGDIAVQQLQANIHHLNGQLAITSAVLEAKNARIEALQLANFTYQQLLATQQQAAAIPLLSQGKPKEDAEPLVPGVIDITKFEGKGFTINFAEILRRLKRRFD